MEEHVTPEELTVDMPVEELETEMRGERSTQLTTAAYGRDTDRKSHSEYRIRG